MFGKIEQVAYIYESTVAGLDKEVNKHLEEGFELYGQPIVNGNVFLQTIVMRKKFNPFQWFVNLG